MRPIHWLCLACLAALAGCAATPATTGGDSPAVVSAASPSPRPSTPPGPLQAEARWLNELFAGTPVAVTEEGGGSILVVVPMRHAFESEQPKRPLLAVLDKLSQSLRRQPAARLQTGAPGPAAPVRLATLRNLLAERGVGSWRVSTGPAAVDAVHLRLLPPR